MGTEQIVIVNADDFGASKGINRGVIRAHSEGPVTSTSLIVNMAASGDAVRRAQEHPDLALGIHVNFTNEGEPVVPLEDVDACRDELKRQIERFLVTVGAPPTHIDSHHNVHLHHPAFEEMFVEASESLRIPLRSFSGVTYVSRFYGRWDGESHPEQVTPTSLLAILDSERHHEVIEFSCHPGYRDPDFTSEYNAERRLELETLCHPVVTEALNERGVVLISFADLQERGLWPGSDRADLRS